MIKFSEKIVQIPQAVQSIKRTVLSVIKSDFVKSPKFDCYVSIPPKAHRPNVLPNAKIVLEKAISDNDLRQIHRIDLEAFSEIDPISTNFNTYKSRLTGLNSYVIKNNDSVVAYYQLEPIKNEDLYIYSIGVPKELRKSKQSYNALKLIQENIKTFAQENGVKTVSLHVDSQNEPLVKMYKKYGFEIVETEPNYYANGNAAYYMEAKVNQEVPVKLPQKKSADIISSNIKSESSVPIKSNIKTRAEMEEYLASIKCQNGELKFRPPYPEIISKYADTPTKMLLLENLARVEKLDYCDPYHIIDNHDYTIETATDIIRLANDEKFWEKADELKKKYDLSLAHLKWLRGRIDFENINERLNRLNLEEVIRPKDIIFIYTDEAILSLNILDDDVIKYAMNALSHRDSAIRNFMCNIGELKIILEKEPYLRLMDKLSKLTMPEQKFKIVQNLSCLSGYDFPATDIDAFINLIKPTKATDEQIALAEKIFTSDKTYPEQIQDFLTQLNIPAERRSRVVSFLEKHKVNEKVFSDRKTGVKTLNVGQNFFNELIEKHINVINNNKELNVFINFKIYEKLGIEPTPELAEKLSFNHQYLSNLFLAIRDEKFATEFKKLIELVKTNPTKPLSELRETLIHNQKTRILFEANGLNYENWIKFDKNLSKSFSIEITLEEAVKAAEEHIVSELTSDLFTSVEKTETDKILKALYDAGYKIEPEKITKNGTAVNKKDLETIVDIFKGTISKNSEFWDKPLSDTKAESLKNELKDHLLKGRRKEVSDLDRISDTKMDLVARLSDDDDIGRNLFLGNHVGCCTSVNGSNGFVAPQHLMNSFIRAIEIVDKSGLSYGNSMCYFAKVDGKLSFIVDSFEANGKLGGNPAVTDTIIDFAKQVTADMGKPNIPIYFGPNYNKISMNKLAKTENHKIEIIGKVDKVTYIDAIGGKRDINDVHYGRDLFEEDLKKAA